MSEFAGYTRNESTESRLIRIEMKLDKLLAKKKPAKPRGSKKHIYDPAFQKIWEKYPVTAGANKQQTYTVYNKRLSEGTDHAIIGAGVINYAAHCKATGCWIKLPQTFLGPCKYYLDDWSIPTQADNVPSENEKLTPWAAEKGYRSAYPGESSADYRKALEQLNRSE